MKPTRKGQAGLVDLLDRVLDKGLILNADLIISLAGVPLIAVSLHAAIASVETMSRYGLMQELIEPSNAGE
ncbi:MAG: gas vesicle protein [Gammaproteobacteria bacterium]|nr:gas vesicle protein [Gammaproteobacteria bacterium]